MVEPITIKSFIHAENIINLKSEIKKSWERRNYESRLNKINIKLKQTNKTNNI